MISPKTYATYFLTSLLTVLAHSFLRLLLHQRATIYLIGLLSPLAYYLIERRQRLTLTNKKTYYIPLAIGLLFLGEVANAINAIVGGNEDPLRRCVIHASLAWIFVAECEWWRSDFVYPPSSPLPFLRN